VVEVDKRDAADSDELLFEAIEQLVGAHSTIPDEAKEEVLQQVAAIEEEMRDHWPGPRPPGDSECRSGCDFEGSIYRHIARHLCFGAFVMAAQQVNATIAGYEERLRDQMRLHDRLTEATNPEEPKKKLVN
jgi:hypothetical protein